MVDVMYGTGKYGGEHLKVSEDILLTPTKYHVTYNKADNNI